MIEVIKRGNHKKRITCPACNSVLEYEPSDEHADRNYDSVMHLDIWSYYIYCPVCKTRIKVRELALED